jgi:hypothetical protein
LRTRNKSWSVLPSDFINSYRLISLQPKKTKTLRRAPSGNNRTIPIESSVEPMSISGKAHEAPGRGCWRRSRRTHSPSLRTIEFAEKVGPEVEIAQVISSWNRQEDVPAYALESHSACNWPQHESACATGRSRAQKASGHRSIGPTKWRALNPIAIAGGRSTRKP